MQKTENERPRKTRESRCLDVSTAAMLARPDTKVRRRFCVKRCGPSRRRVRTASAVLKNFVHQPEKTFSTVSSPLRHADCTEQCPLSGVTRKTFAQVRRRSGVQRSLTT